MYNTLPIFKSHYSIGRSVLTLQNPTEMKENGPASIIDICIKNNLKKFFLVDDSMAGFLEAYSNSKENNLEMTYGLRITVCEDMSDKSEGSLRRAFKCVIMCNDNDGYYSLIKIYSLAAKTGFYYEPRIDYKSLSSLWSEKSLSMCIPFYDSFLYKNLLTPSICVPALDFTNPTFFVEDNGLPFDALLKRQIEEYTKRKHEMVSVKSIYYNLRKDFKSYLTFRCINKRSTLDRPNLDHMCSDNFCLESWKSQNG